MFFAVTTQLDPKGRDKRASATSQHRAYLAAHSHMLIAAGPTLTSDGETPIGSAYIIEAETETAARAFVDNDPMTLSGARRAITVERWRPAGFNRVYPLDEAALGTRTDPPQRSVHKRAALVLLCMYPLTTAIRFLLDPMLNLMPLPLQTLLTVTPAVLILVYLLLPTADRLLKRADDQLMARSYIEKEHG